MLKSTLLALALLAAPLAASAQTPPPGPSVTMSPVNCDALNKGTMICVRNATTRPIVKITCTGNGYWGNTPTDLSIAHGVIASGETTIVDFPADRCTKHILVYTRDGRQFPYDGFDTKNNTTLIVDNG